MDGLPNRFLQRLRECDRPLVIAHRGASAHAPENTTLAARLGWETGADAWEFDLHLTRDGHPVVIHDESLLRTTDVARRFLGDPRALHGYLVADFDLEEIRSLDAGKWFLEEPGDRRAAAGFATRDQLDPDTTDAIRSGVVCVPTLAEALDLTRSLDWMCNIELKTFPNLQPMLLEQALAEIDRFGLDARVLISSFNHEDLSRARSLRPAIATGVLHESPLCQAARYLREIVQADCVHPSAAAMGSASDAYRRAPGAGRLRSSLAQTLREAGIPVLVHTVNDARPDGLGRHLAEIGVSALFTDSPEAMIDGLDAG